MAQQLARGLAENRTVSFEGWFGYDCISHPPLGTWMDADFVDPATWPSLTPRVSDPMRKGLGGKDDHIVYRVSLHTSAA
eukprot:gene32944-48899_t